MAGIDPCAEELVGAACNLRIILHLIPDDTATREARPYVQRSHEACSSNKSHETYRTLIAQCASLFSAVFPQASRRSTKTRTLLGDGDGDGDDDAEPSRTWWRVKARA
jgi:hypothetical protein